MARPGVDEWRELSSAFDRVQAVASTLTEPRTAAYIADEAHVDKGAAQEHIDQLVDLGVLQRSDDEGATRYAPDPLHSRMQTLRDLLNEYDRQGLDELRYELQEQMDALEGREQDLCEYRLGLVEEAADVRDRYA